MHGKFYRGHARYACRRTPRQTSGLPAGAEPSFESKDIIASTNPECPDTFEYSRTTQLHGYGVTGLQGYMATHREEYGDYFAIQSFGAITPGAPALKLSCRTLAGIFQFKQSSVRELQFSNMLCALVVFEKSISPKSMLSRDRQLLNMMPDSVGEPFHPEKVTNLSERQSVSIDSILPSCETFIPESSSSVSDLQHQKVCPQSLHSETSSFLISAVFRFENSWNQKSILRGLIPRSITETDSTSPCCRPG